MYGSKTQNRRLNVQANVCISSLPGFVALPVNGDYSPEWRAGLFAGNQPSFARHLADITNATSGGPLQPATDEQRVLHPHLNTKEGAYEQRRKVG